MANETIPRRDFLKGAGVAGASVAAAASGISACSPETTAPNAAAKAEATPESWLILTPQQVAFFAAAADTIVPKDELSPSGSECGIPAFIDRQLASAWGGG